MIIHRILNNNAVMCFNENNEEVIIEKRQEMNLIKKKLKRFLFVIQKKLLQDIKKF